MPIEVDDQGALRGLQSVVAALNEPFPRNALEVMLRAARTRAPVVTGRLRASGRLQQSGLLFAVPYSAPIHWGWRARNISPNHYAVSGIAATEDEWLGQYTDQILEGF